MSEHDRRELTRMNTKENIGICVMKSSASSTSVYNEFGYGFLEAVYEEAFSICFRERLD